MKTLSLALASVLFVACGHANESSASSDADFSAVAASDVVGDIDVGQTKPLAYDPAKQNVLHFAARAGDVVSVTATDQRSVDGAPLISVLDKNGNAISHGESTEIQASGDIYIFARPPMFKATTFNVTLGGQRAATAFTYPTWASGKTLPLTLTCTILADLNSFGESQPEMQFQVIGSLAVTPIDPNGVTQHATWTQTQTFDWEDDGEILDGYRLITGTDSVSPLAFLDFTQPENEDGELSVRETTTALNVDWQDPQATGNYFESASASAAITSAGVKVTFATQKPNVYNNALEGNVSCVGTASAP